MKRSIGALSRLSGVSVRALRYYDQLGLLPPSEIAESGYRYYDDAAVERLWQILFYRELDFPLEDIAEILSSPDFDRRRALTEHRALLVQKRERLDGLISLLTDTLKGERTMEFQPFDTAKIDELREQYAEEAKSRWGGTPEYRESAARETARSSEERARVQTEEREIFAAFAALRDADAGDARVQALVKRWQAHITKHYYTCTGEILAGLGKMYTADERFKKNIDRFGAGTASLMSDAIAYYCKKEV
ncbi:MAG TPA: MerR family transcriptional regulator [Eubacteriales bacterium]|nr:MerR family transcriptional regulator [Eubacteriales bacterium]